MTTPTLTVALFGNPSMRIGDEPVTGLPSSKVAALAYYLFATDRVHGRDTLASLLWPDYENSQSKKNLRGALYHLRNALAPYVNVSRKQAGPADADIQVDTRHFELLLQQTAGHPANSPEQIACLRRAVTHYHGPFLEGFHTDNAEPFEEWARVERERLGQMVTQTLNTLVIHSIETGDYLQGIHDATQLLALDSLREETHRHLMLMLTMDGQQRAALAQYEVCARILNAELGITPAPETELLAERIRAGEFAGDRPQFHLPPPPKRHNLPAELAPFLGREAEVQQIVRTLAEPSGRLITLVGVGGIGKTRLAIRVGHQLMKIIDAVDVGDELDAWAQPAAQAAANGVYFVRLASIEADEESDSRIIAAIAAALQIELTGDGAMMDQLLQPLQGRQIVLLLDNFEQLQPRASLIVDLLEQADSLRVITTSRTRLNLRGEQVIMLDGLPAPDIPDAGALLSHPATALYVSTAMAVSPSFVPDADVAAAIVRTCNLLQGLPLGIELAAAWTRMLSCQEIVEELQQNLDFLTGAMPDLPERHRSLRAVFDQSWEMLTPNEQDVLQRLAIFRDGFRRKAAAFVASALLPELVSLMDNSLVKRSEVELENGDTVIRYELPEVLRQYVDERLHASGAYDATAAGHASYYADYLAAIEPEFHGGDQIVALEQVTLELENTRAAWEWACRTLVKGGAAEGRGGLRPVVRRGSRTAAEQCAESRREPQRLLEEAALDYLRRSHQGFFDFHDIRGWFEEGERIFRQAADAVAKCAHAADDETVLLARLQARQAWFLFHLGQHDASEQLLLASLAELREQGASADMVFNLGYLGAVKRHTGDFDAARAYLQQALELADAGGDRYGASMALNTLGQVAWLQGDFDATVDYCERALALKRTMGDRRGMIYSLTYLGRVAEMREEYNDARGHLVESLRIAEALDDPRGMAQAQQNLANLAYAQGDLTVARRLYQSCLELHRYTGSRIESSVVLTRLGEVATGRGEYAVAADNLSLALESAVSIRSKPALLTGLLGMAQLRAAQEQFDDASHILAVVARYGDLDERQRNRYQQLAATVGSVQDDSAQDDTDTTQPSIDALIACAHECRPLFFRISPPTN